MVGGIVTALAQDARGWLWIGTQSGLIGYDGYRFHKHTHASGDPGSLAGDYVTALWAAPDGRIWVGTQIGLGLHIVYNLVTQTFHGTIECRSAPGAGCVFALALRMAER